MSIDKLLKTIKNLKAEATSKYDYLTKRNMFSRVLATEHKMDPSLEVLNLIIQVNELSCITKKRNTTDDGMVYTFQWKNLQGEIQKATFRQDFLETKPEKVLFKLNEGGLSDIPTEEPHRSGLVKKLLELAS